MRRKQNKLCLRLINMSIVLATVPILMGCYNEEIDTLSLITEPEPVYIHVSADVLGDLNSTRATDPYAEDGEFMNTLCVFVVDANNVIEAKFGPDVILEGYTAATTGDLTDWTSDKLTLTAGEKTIYAFSNWDNTGSTEWAALIAKGEGESISSTDLNFVVDDPASNVDIASGKYIPMSGMTTAIVSSTSDINYNQLIEVGMDRLVGKVNIMIDGETSVLDDDGNQEAQNVLLKSLSFSGWADVVPMMSNDNSTYTYTFNKGYETELSQTINVGETSVPIASFYVNETNREDLGGFDITLETDRFGGIYYTATTTTTAIPRNYILPIRLTLDQYVLDLEIHAWTSPLGIEEVPYYNVDIEGNTWNIALLDVTSTFEFIPTMSYKGNEMNDITWTWEYLNTDEAKITKDDTGAITVTGLTATPGYEYQFTLVGNWTTDSGTAHSRTYNVNVTFVDGWPDFTRATSTWSFTSMQNEWLNMIIQDY